MPENAETLSAESLGAKLAKKHKIFADTYLMNGLNASAAAASLNYADFREGYRLTQREDVSSYIQARLNEAGLTSDEIKRRLEYFAAADMRDFLSISPTERSYWIRADQSEELREAAKRKGVSVQDLDNYDISGIVGSENVAQTEDGVLMVCVKQVDAEVTVDWRAAQKAQALGRIKKLKIGKDGAVEFELHDPVKTLELLGKAQKMFTDRTEHSGSVDLGVIGIDFIMPGEPGEGGSE